MINENTLSEPQITYGAIDGNHILQLIQTVKQGVEYDMFMRIAKKSPFNIEEWCSFLHLSERTLQRYKKESKSFNPIIFKKKYWN